MSRAAHWENVYLSKADRELSWFQPSPSVSLDLIDGLVPRPTSVVDVGGGQSALAGELLDRGVTGITVVDISPAALERGRTRLGSRSGLVRWVAGDVLEAADLGPCDLWHDRAVFHFLTERADRSRYVEAAARAVAPRGHAIVATFALTGPEKCSGLAVMRYDAASLANEFRSAFELVTSAAETHTTPWGKPQDFVYVVLRRVG